MDTNYLRHAGKSDVVYSWGALHHTDAIWDALANVAPLVNPKGKLYISTYNDVSGKSWRWARIKKLYNRLTKGFRFLVLSPAFMRLRLPTKCLEFLRFGNPLRSWDNYYRVRGMSAWHDVVD